jgi:aspartyl/asparaginyl-tRNA synthetase
MIDYKILDDSLKYYETNGFKRIEAPWTVSAYVDDITKPKEQTPFELKHNNKRLVASGEQSFLYLYLKEFLPLGQYQTITPCFRMEAFDFSHTKYFMKNELIKTDVVNQEELMKVIDISLIFFRTYIPDAQLVKTDIGYDIMYKEHELGSYGIRKCEFLEWIYGTGCAEPRLSKIIELYGLS